MKRRAAAALLALSLLGPLQAFAQAPAAAPPHVADLDRLYAAGQYKAVARAMFAPRAEAQARAVLNWAQARLQAGAPHLIGVAYGDLLWQIGEGQRNEPLRTEAALVLVSTILAVAADGAKCADTEAADMRVRQILAARAALLHYARNLPQERRVRLRNEALALEQSLAARRPPDDEICMAGPRELGRQLETPGTVAREQPLRPGTVARTVDIEPGPTYRPQYLSPERWHARQAQVRARFPALLDQLVPAN
jgi:hypothetical protein